MLTFIYLVAITAEAMSGALAAGRRRMDIFGVAVVAFVTALGGGTVRDLILVEAVSGDGVSGWGECVTMSWPGYSYEYSDTAIDVIGRHLLPALAEAGDDPAEVRSALDVVRGHPMAKTAVTTALLDVWLRERSQSLASWLGATRTHVDSGVSVGIPTTESIPELLDEVAGYLDAGYRRIKLKIEPGWDLAPVGAAARPLALRVGGGR